MRDELLPHLVAPDEPERRGFPLRLVSFRREGEHVMDGVLIADDGRWWWIAGGIPRLLAPALYDNPELRERYAADLRRLGLETARPGPARECAALDALGERTIDRFGAEWLTFRDWGFHDEDRRGDPEFQGGLWEDTLRAFAHKTFLDGLVSRSLCLDAGCGNGRFTAAALEHGAREVIALDLGWGVEAAFERFRNNPRVHVVQASLFELPVRRVEVAFSIGVLMHTGDAAGALRSIAACLGPGGLLAVRMYHRGNWAYEGLDRAFRAVTTRLGRPAQERLAARMAALGRWLMARDARRPGSRMRWYRLFRNWPTVHHNLDWWGAPAATHHTVGEVAAWGGGAGLEAVRTAPGLYPSRYGFWEWPEALTILFQRPLRVIAEPKPIPAPAPHQRAGVRAA